MYIPDILDIYEAHEREQGRLERRRESIERLIEKEEERDEERITSKN